MFFLLSIFSFNFTSFSQGMQFDFDTYNTDNNVSEVIWGPQSLNQGQAYQFKLTGTYSVWAPSFWTTPCGNYELSPMFFSNGNINRGGVGFDPAFTFSLPNSSLCANSNLPSINTRIEYTLDSGMTWIPFSSNLNYDTSHVYVQVIQGQGHPIGIRQVSPLNDDDYGVLKVNIQFNTGLTEFVIEKPALYPNPSNQFTLVDLKENQYEIASLIDVNGRLVMKKSIASLQRFQIGTYNLSNGIYSIILEGQIQKDHLKLMVIH